MSKNETIMTFLSQLGNDSGGIRTKGSSLAQDICYEFVQERLMVLTLEDTLGQQFEPYIFSAHNPSILSSFASSSGSFAAAPFLERCIKRVKTLACRRIS